MACTDCHLIKHGITGPETECGDTGFIHRTETACFISLVDILGHGADAYDVAVLAHDYLSRNHKGPLDDIIMGLHEHLNGTRGGVAALCRLNLSNGKMDFVGVGNITCRIFGPDHQRMLSKDGIVGYMMQRPEVKTAQIYPKDVVMLYSDGIKEHFELFDAPGLLTGSVREIAERVISNFAKGDDDASCLVMRYCP